MPIFGYSRNPSRGTNEEEIINLFGFTFQNVVLEWEEMFLLNHPNCTFAKSKYFYTP
jgi:hypothetical protein